MFERLRITPSLPRSGDQWVAGIASLLPMSLVLGNVAFEVVIGLTGLLWLVQSVFIRHESLLRIRRHLIFWPLVIWMTGIMLSRVANPFSTIEFFHDLVFLRFVLFVLAIVDISVRLPIDRYLLGGAVAGIIWAAFNTLCAHVLGFDSIGAPVRFYTDKLLTAERIAVFCAYMFPFFVVRLTSCRDKERAEKIFLCVLTVLCLGLLVLMKIRTAWLAAAIGILGGAVIALCGRVRWLMAGSIAMAVIAGGSLVYYTGYQRGLDTVYDRYWIWQRSLTLWLEHPLLGVGVSGFAKAFHHLVADTDLKPYIAPNGQAYKFDNATNAHNLVLTLLSCTGLWGLGSFFWLVIAATRQWLKDDFSRRISLGVIPFVLVGIGLTGYSIYDSFYASIVMYFLAWMASRTAGNHGQEGVLS
jgi:O-antigen ligase